MNKRLRQVKSQDLKAFCGAGCFKHVLRSQQGFSMITVIFLLVVLTGLGTVILQVGTTQHMGMAMALEGRQAYYAARAGLEWGRHVLINSDICNASTTLDVAGYSVTLECTKKTTVPVKEGDQQYTPYNLATTASKNIGAADEVRRELIMSLWK